jgi:sRNA-binding regulator protein Hfq
MKEEQINAKITGVDQFIIVLTKKERVTLLFIKKNLTV